MSALTTLPALPADVAVSFDALPSEARDVLLDLRGLIFETATEDPRIGAINEVLRWGEPAYITARAITGSTLRLGIEKTSGKPALFFNCNTSLVEGFRERFGAQLSYSKNRAVLIDRDVSGNDTPGSNAETHRQALRHCIHAALSYHLKP